MSVNVCYKMTYMYKSIDPFYENSQHAKNTKIRDPSYRAICSMTRSLSDGQQTDILIKI